MLSAESSDILHNAMWISCKLCLDVADGGFGILKQILSDAVLLILGHEVRCNLIGNMQ